MNKAMGVENPAKQKTGKIGHEPTPQKRIRAKYALTNKQQKSAERKEKKRRQMEYQSRRINRLRG